MNAKPRSCRSCWRRRSSPPAAAAPTPSSGRSTWRRWKPASGWRRPASARSPPTVNAASSARCSRRPQSAAAGRKRWPGSASPGWNWSNYRGAGDAGSKFPGILWSGGLGSPTSRGVHGALMDLEYERMELIKFNLFDNCGTYRVRGGARRRGRAVAQGVASDAPASRTTPTTRRWAATASSCAGGELIRWRTATGICNDMRNPRWARPDMPFARNVQFAATFPRARGAPSWRETATAAGIDLLQPDPQVISRKLFTRAQSDPERVQRRPRPARRLARRPLRLHAGTVLQRARGVLDPVHDARLVLALEEGHNQAEYMTVGCATQKATASSARCPAEGSATLGCRPADRMDKGYMAEASEPPETFTYQGQDASDPRAEGHRQHRHRLVGRLSALRLRRHFARAGASATRTIPRSCACCGSGPVPAPAGPGLPAAAV